MYNRKRIILWLFVAAILGAIYYFESSKSPQRLVGEEQEIIREGITMDKDEKAKKYPRAKEIVNLAGFINTDTITVSELVGKKVILIDFWTYSCINCQRTTPYLNAWYKKYKDQGFVIIGVHTPEFAFEKVYKNVEQAVSQFGIQYPVVLDNDYATWNAYKNRYWPRKYLIDIDGFIVYDHIGEGGYEETEKKIQELLDERMVAFDMKESVDKEISKPEGIASIDFSKVRSPEIYFGALRNTYLGNGKSGATGIQTLGEPTGIKTNILYLAGDWDFQGEFAENKNTNAKIIFRYQAKDVYLVATAEEGVTMQILRDGKPLGNEAGRDVLNGRVTIKEDRLYKLIEDSDYGEHTLEIIIENPGLRAFAFTFG